MSKNQTSVNEPVKDELISNSELIERQITHLLTVRHYLEDQLEQVNKALDEYDLKLNPSKVES